MYNYCSFHNEFIRWKYVSTYIKYLKFEIILQSCFFYFYGISPLHKSYLTLIKKSLTIQRIFLDDYYYMGFLIKELN